MSDRSRSRAAKTSTDRARGRFFFFTIRHPRPARVGFVQNVVALCFDLGVDRLEPFRFTARRGFPQPGDFAVLRVVVRGGGRLAQASHRVDEPLALRRDVQRPGEDDAARSCRELVRLARRGFVPVAARYQRDAAHAVLASASLRERAQVPRIERVPHVRLSGHQRPADFFLPPRQERLIAVQLVPLLLPAERRALLVQSVRVHRKRRGPTNAGPWPPPRARGEVNSRRGFLAVLLVIVQRFRRLPIPGWPICGKVGADSSGRASGAITLASG